MIIDPKKNKIIAFLQKTFKKTHHTKAVIGLSGGIDSTVSYFLLKNAIGAKNILAYHLPYSTDFQKTIKLFCPDVKIIYIKPLVRLFSKKINVSTTDTIRLGNIMARVRMIILFDQAKKYKSLVCGTENRSEHLLGYYTRYGDQAVDIEPIVHLYKTQVYEFAKKLAVPRVICESKPSAGLWANQTDEGQFGFSYKEADKVLYHYFDKKYPESKIRKLFPKGEEILKWVNENRYKSEVPYSFEQR